MDSVSITMAVISAISALAGALIGAFGSVYSQKQAAIVQQKIAQKSLAAGLSAEIAAFMDIVERRGQVEWVENTVSRLRSGNDIQLPRLFDPDDEILEPFPVFSNNVASLGVLGPDLTERVVKVINLIAAIRSTSRRISLGQLDELDAARKADVLEGEMAIWREVVDAWRDLSEQLKKLAEAK